MLPPDSTPVFVPIANLLMFSNFRFLAEKHVQKWPSLETVRVVRDQDWLILVEGFGRVDYLRHQEQTSVLATVVNGTITDALQCVIDIYLSGDNTESDTARAIAIAHDHPPWQHMSPTDLARTTGLPIAANYHFNDDPPAKQKPAPTIKKKSVRTVQEIEAVRVTVRALLKSEPNTTDRRIAVDAGCSLGLVAKLRRQLGIDSTHQLRKLRSSVTAQ